MTQANSEARKKYWASMTQEERTARAKTLAKQGQKKLTFAERRAHALRMVAARRAKQKLRKSKTVV